MCDKGVKYVNTYIYCIEINKSITLFLVVGAFDIGIGWRAFWSYILIIKKLAFGRVFYKLKFYILAFFLQVSRISSACSFNSF